MGGFWDQFVLCDIGWRPADRYRLPIIVSFMYLTFSLVVVFIGEIIELSIMLLDIYLLTALSPDVCCGHAPINHHCRPITIYVC